VPDIALDCIVETFEAMWEEGKSVKEIAEELQFEDEENTPWEGKLRPHMVYYFAKKLHLEKRHKHSKKKQSVTNS